MNDELKINLSEDHELNYILDKRGFRGTEGNRDILKKAIQEMAKLTESYNKWQTLDEKNSFIDRVIHGCSNNLERLKT